MEHIDYSTAEAESLLKECRQLVFQVTKENDALLQENTALKQEVSRLRVAGGHTLATETMKPQVLQQPGTYTMVWYQEWIDMQNSFSWKITKPLRMVKKVLSSLRTYGLRITISKIMQKLRSR